jgi:hypothetical protein
MIIERQQNHVHIAVEEGGLTLCRKMMNVKHVEVMDGEKLVNTPSHF